MNGEKKLSGTMKHQLQDKGHNFGGQRVNDGPLNFLGLLRQMFPLTKPRPPGEDFQAQEMHSCVLSPTPPKIK